MAFALRVPRPGEADLRVRPLPLFYRSWGRGEHSPLRVPRMEGTDLRVRPLPSYIVRGVRANGIRFTCAKTKRGRSTCLPASFLYRSRGRGEWHSPYVYRGRNGIRTATDATERGSPTGLFFGISPSARGCIFYLMESLNPFWRRPYHLNWNQSL